MRVRLYWSMARLAHQEGRASVALTNVRKAIALLQATDDSFHLARAHILAAGITLSRDDVDGCERHLDHAEQLLGAHPSMQDAVEIKILRSRRGTSPRERDRGGRARTGDARPRRRRIAGGRGPGVLGARRRTGARRRASRRRRGVPARGRSARGAGPVARRDAGVPVVGADAPRDGARGAGARRPRPRRPSSGCGRRRRTPAPSVELRAPGLSPRSVLARPLRTALERRDANVPRRTADGAPRRRRPVEVARAWQAPDGTVTIGRSRRRRRAAALDPRARRRPLRLPAPRARRPDARPRVARAARASPGAGADGRAGAVARVLRPADRGEGGTAAGAEGDPRRLRRRSRRAARRSHDTGSRRPRAVAAARARAARAAGGGARPSLPGTRSRAPPRRADRGGRPAARARAGTRALVGRRRVPAGTRPVRRGSRRRPRSREAPALAARPSGRDRGDRRAAGAVRRVGRSRERLPDQRQRPRPAAAAANAAPRSKTVAMAENRIAILGAGRIGEALLTGLLSSGWRTKEQLVVTRAARAASRSCGRGTASRRPRPTRTRSPARRSSSSR